jgi:glycosyltransferase involved in cell wall biosynthesis
VTAREAIEAPFLTAAMIVRNEERFLGGCLASIRSIVDEIVIADTGSSDRSRDIALEYGARLIDHPWSGDFAAARNAALDQARGRWILYIDADERLAPVERDDVRAALGDPGLVAGLVWFRARTGYTPYREYRLFRNDPRIRFHGVIHETMLADIDEVARQDGLRVGEVELLLEHLGYDGPQEHKHRRNLPLLEAALVTRPDNAYLWQQLGITREALGDLRGAEAAWRASVDVVRRVGVLRSSDCIAYIDLIRTGLADSAMASGFYAEAKRLFPENPLLLYWGARLAERIGDDEAAIAGFRQLAAIDPESYRERRIGLDKRLFSEDVPAWLATCLFKRGEYAESAAWFAKAAAANPDSLEYRTKHLLAASRSRGPEGTQLATPGSVS